MRRQPCRAERTSDGPTRQPTPPYGNILVRVFPGQGRLAGSGSPSVMVAQGFAALAGGIRRPVLVDDTGPPPFIEVCLSLR